MRCAEAEKGEPRTLYKGVTRLGKERKWVARVWVDSKQKTVGRYDSDVAAAQVAPCRLSLLALHPFSIISGHCLPHTSA